jgi:DNA-binding MarR family transcriptional regulator
VVSEASDDGRRNLAVLLAAAQRRYGYSIRVALAAIGAHDLPRSGAWVLAALERSPASVNEVAAMISSSKQAVSRLVDRMVQLGYVERSTDPSDRRQVTLTITDRGAKAAAAVRLARRDVDRQLAAAVGTQELDTTIEVLATLAHGLADPDQGVSAPVE